MIWPSRDLPPRLERGRVESHLMLFSEYYRGAEELRAFLVGTRHRFELERHSSGRRPVRRVTGGRGSFTDDATASEQTRTGNLSAERDNL